jgi:hypothetical protein
LRQRFLAVVIGALAVLLPGLTWGHYWFQRATVDPVTTTVRGTPTTGSPVLGAPSATQFFCRTASGQHVNGPHTTLALANAACDLTTPVQTDGAQRVVVEVSTRLETVTTTTPVVQTTPRTNVYGGTTLRVSDAHAQFIGMQRGGTPFVENDEPWAGTDGCYNPTSGELADIEWQNGSGAWGAQVTYTTVTPTTASGDPVEVDSAAEFNAAAAVTGTVIHVVGDISSNVQITASNLDIVVMPGVEMQAIGGNPSVTARNSIRIRGTTTCSHSGGQIGQLVIHGTNNILDGIDSNAAGQFDGDYSCLRTDDPGTWAIVYYRCHSPDQGWNYGGSSSLQVYCRDSSVRSGSRAQPDVGSDAQWANRWNSGRFYYFGCDIRNDKYATMRMHTNTGVSGELIYFKDSTFVNYAEARPIWGWHQINGSTGPGEGLVLVNPRIAAYAETGGGGCLFSGASNPHVELNGGTTVVAYTRIRGGGTIYSGGSVTASQGGFDTEAAQSADGDWNDATDPLTFTSFSADLPWEGAGDPTTITLPDGIAYSTGESPCSGPSFM